MNKLEELADVSKSLADAKAKVLELEDRQRELFKEAGAELGFRVSAIHKAADYIAVPDRKPGAPLKRGDKTDYERCIDALADRGQSRSADLEVYLRENGTPVPASSIRQYLIRAFNEGEAIRVEGQKGLYARKQAMQDGNEQTAMPLVN